MGQHGPCADRDRASEVSVPERVLVSWKGERRFESGREGRPPVLLDGDGKAAPSPPEALLAALASCVSVDVVDILAKRRTPVESYGVEVLGERVDTTPRRFKHIVLNINIRGAGIERDQAERAIDLAVNKYCSVRDSLAPDIPVVWNLALNEPPVG
jgi:putative redox protein